MKNLSDLRRAEPAAAREFDYFIDELEQRGYEVDITFRNNNKREIYIE